MLYASKAFQNKEMMRIVDDEGLCLDVSGGGELACAQAAGFPMDRVFVHGNNKTPTELREAIAHHLYQFRGILAVKVHNRHVDHLVEVFPIQGKHLIGRFRALHDDLPRRSGPLQHRRHQVEIAVGLVEIHQHTSLGGQQRLFECRNRVFGPDAAAVLEFQCTDRIQRPVGNAPLSGRRAVQRGVVHDNQHAVARQLKIQLHHIDAHGYRVFDGCDGVFRSVAPVAAVRHDENRGRIARKKTCPEPFGPVLRSGALRGLSGAACQHDKCQQAGKHPLHIS